MQLVNCMVALGGDIRNTVPKSGITVAEAAVLRAIHGPGGVFDVEVVGEETRNNRQELARLKKDYARARDENGISHVEAIYPGAAARVFERVDELDLSDEQMKAVARAPRGTVKREESDEGAPARPGAVKTDAPKGKGRGKKADAASVAPIAIPDRKVEEQDEDDDLPELPADRDDDVMG